MKYSPLRGKSRTEPRSRSPIRSSEPALQQMRNFLFQGAISSSYLLQGKGLLLTDESIAYCGELKHDKPHGFGLMVFDSQAFLRAGFAQSPRQFLAVGRWQNGVPEGPLLLHSDSHLLIVQYAGGALHGQLHRLHFEDNTWKSFEYSGGTKRRLVYSGQKVPPGLRNQVEQHRLFLGYVERSFPEIGQRWGQTELAFQRGEDYDFIGFSCNGSPQGLGLRLKNYKLVEAGVFKEGVLEGFGIRRLADLSCYEGSFRKGGFEGLGLFYSQSRGSYLVGAFLESKCVKVYDQGRGRGREIFIRIKNLQVRNHPKVINKVVDLSRVAGELLGEVQRQQQVKHPEETATLSRKEAERLAREEKIDQLNRVIEEASVGSARLQQLQVGSTTKRSEKERADLFAQRVLQFSRESSPARSQLGQSGRRRLFAEREEPGWRDEEVGEEIVPGSVQRMRISRV